MIKVDISNVWGSIEFSDLMSIEREVSAAHACLNSRGDDLIQHYGWMKLPTHDFLPEIQRIQEQAQKIREESDAFVVVGAGNFTLGARAAVNLLCGQPCSAGSGSRGEPQLIYTGDSFSTRRWAQLKETLEDKDFSVAVISKSGSEIESAIALRKLRWILERRYGTDGARKRMIAVTGNSEGNLHQMAQSEEWNCFSIPADVDSRFSVLSPAGLLPMAVSGLNIRKMMSGAAEAMENYAAASYENPVWLYAAVRNLMLRSGKTVEVLGGFEPGLRTFGAWWQQLFGASEGSAQRCLFPAPAEFPTDLYSIGPLLSGGNGSLFETLVRFNPFTHGYTIGTDVKDPDGLNAIAGRSPDEIGECACQAAALAHFESGIPVITMDCGDLNEEKAGELFYFMELSCALSANILKINSVGSPEFDPYGGNLSGMTASPKQPGA